MTASEAVKAYREEHDLSIRAMAQLVGCNHTTLYRIEKGIYRPNMYTLHRIATVTGADIDTLYNDTLHMGNPDPDEEKVLEAYRQAPDLIRQAIKDILHIQKEAPSD